MSYRQRTYKVDDWAHGEMVLGGSGARQLRPCVCVECGHTNYIEHGEKLASCRVCGKAMRRINAWETSPADWAL